MSEVKRKRKPYSEISEEEKAYRKEWRKNNTMMVGIHINKKLKKELIDACNTLKITQHSVFKKAIDETIKKTNQLDEE